MSDLRDDRLPRIRVMENSQHMTTCTSCTMKFDTRLFVGCPFCAIQQMRRNRRATDTPAA